MAGSSFRSGNFLYKKTCDRLFWVFIPILWESDTRDSFGHFSMGVDCIEQLLFSRWKVMSKVRMSPCGILGCLFPNRTQEKNEEIPPSKIAQNEVENK